MNNNGSFSRKRNDNYLSQEGLKLDTELDFAKLDYGDAQDTLITLQNRRFGSHFTYLVLPQQVD